MRGASNYLSRGVNETNDVRGWASALTLGCACLVDATTIPRPSLFSASTRTHYFALFSFLSLPSPSLSRLIIFNHNHARSSRRSDRLRFIVRINVWRCLAGDHLRQIARISSASCVSSSTSAVVLSTSHVANNNLFSFCLEVFYT